MRVPASVRGGLTQPANSVILSIRSFISVGVTSWSRRKTTPRSETEEYESLGQPSSEHPEKLWHLVKLTRNSKISNHIIAPFEEISHLEAFVLAPNHWGNILVGEFVQCASVLQRLQQTRTGLGVAAKELAVRLSLARGQLYRRHDIGRSAVRGFLIGMTQLSGGRGNLRRCEAT